jgi:hypothetical protein
MNWKDTSSGGSTARAAREVGGCYYIARRESYLSWRGETIEAHYEINYRRRTTHDWNEIDYPRGEPGTLAEAKRMAEEDQEQRRQEIRLEQHDGACRA